jgi:L-iditol 2-dehydrogenase
MMRQAFIDAPGSEFVVRQMPIPCPGPAEALIRVTVATICSRTDLGAIDGLHPPHGSAAAGMLPHDLRLQLGRVDHDVSRPYYPSQAHHQAAFPAVMGHEAAGIVEQLGQDANDRDNLVFPDQPLAVGDRVATYRVHGGYSDYAVLTTNNLVKVPDFMSDEDASLIEPLIANYNCLRRCWSISEPQSILILGQGCQGLFATQIARALGARMIIVSEPSQHKRKLASDLGADVALDPASSNIVHAVERLTGLAGADLVIECVGDEDAIRSVPFLVRRGGMVAQIGALTRPVTFDYGYTHFKHFMVIPVDLFHTLRDISDQVAELIELIRTAKVQPAKLISHRFGLDEIQAAFSLIRACPDELVKVAIYPM